MKFMMTSPVLNLVLMSAASCFASGGPIGSGADISHSPGIVERSVRIILDTDMLTDCDDTAALAMLHTFADAGVAEILAVTVSSRYPASGAVVDAVNTYYGRGSLPVGVPKNGTGAYRTDSSFLDKVSAEFPHNLKSNDAAEDAVRVIRRALATSDKPVTLVTIGYLTNIAGLLKSEPDDISPLSGMDLVRKHVSKWVCMGGNFPVDPAKDNVNFTRDPEPALYAIRNFPGNLVFCGREIGHSIFVGECLKGLPTSNPVRRAYELHRGRYGDNWDHHTADPTTVLFAVLGRGDFFDMESGTIAIQDDCSFVWMPKVPSNRYRLIQKMSRNEMGRFMGEWMTKSSRGDTKE